MNELTLTLGLGIAVMALLAEYVDSSLGMGYGTIMTPTLLLMGFAPLQVVPVVLLSELATGLLGGFTHHAAGNVDFRPKTMKIKEIVRHLKEFGIVRTCEKNLSAHFKIAILFTACGVIGTILAVVFAVSLPEYYLRLGIGYLVLVIGLVILVTLEKQFRFSWRKIILLSLIASFNKGVSGGGYGPVITSGQLLSGVEGKNAVGITSLAEGLTCLVGVIAYVITRDGIDWRLAPYMITGAVCAVPIAVLTVKKMKIKRLRLGIGIATLFLGAFTILKTIQ
jgi:uncharacterized protein